MGDLDVDKTDVMTEMFGDIIEDLPVETPPDETPQEETPPEGTPELEKPEAEEVKGDEKPPETPPAKVEGVDVPEDKVPEGFVPIPVHAELRSKYRDKESSLKQELSTAQIATAKAEARAELLEQMMTKAQQAPKEPPPPPEKNPLEKFNEEFPGEPLTAKVLLDQQAWDRKQDSQRAVQTQTQTQEQLVNEGIAEARDRYSAEKMGSEELTLDAVVGLARSHNLITEKDLKHLAPYGKRAGTVLFNLATESIKLAGGNPLQELNRRIVAVRQKTAEANAAEAALKNKNTPPAKPAVPAKVKEAPKPVEEEDTNVSGITDFMFR